MREWRAVRVALASRPRQRNLWCWWCRFGGYFQRPCCTRATPLPLDVWDCLPRLACDVSTRRKGTLRAPFRTGILCPLQRALRTACQRSQLRSLRRPCTGGNTDASVQRWVPAWVPVASRWPLDAVVLLVPMAPWRERILRAPCIAHPPSARRFIAKLACLATPPDSAWPDWKHPGHRLLWPMVIERAAHAVCPCGQFKAL